MALKCESGLILCREVAEQECAICGRYFCGKHGDVQAPHCRRCARAFAERERETQAAAAEVTRREMAAQHNTDGRCGWLGCSGPVLVLCQHCGLKYCTQHSNRYHYNYRYRTRRGVDLRHAAVTLCDACKPALKSYKREKTWLEV